MCGVTAGVRFIRPRGEGRRTRKSLYLVREAEKRPPERVLRRAISNVPAGSLAADEVLVRRVALVR